MPFKRFNVFPSSRGPKIVNLNGKKHRKHRVVPWLESPLHGADEEELVFAQRHEANPLELFFDLFFVANLATFTAYHTVTGASDLYSYIGFFAVIWTTWFQVTLHDVRFARDSIYERACKTIQFVAFVGYALVGSSFQPDGKAKSNTNFRILCYTLLLSRTLLAIQYIVVLLCTVAAKGYNKLYLPLGLNALVYLIGAGIFGAMTPAFSETSRIHKGLYSVWWIVMLFESLLTIGISSKWRMLSFKKTHIVERMGLLTLIVIGEGAIGVTKTISKMMGKYGINPEASGLIVCILLVLVFIWMLYFDNQPHGHYGTIRQQIWSFLHFPLHLAIVGVVEGSQQIALARYIVKQTNKLSAKFTSACFEEHLDGNELLEALDKAIDYYQLDHKAESRLYLQNVTTDLEIIANATGICSSDNLPESMVKTGRFPDDLLNLYHDVSSGIYAALGQKLPLNRPAIEVAIDSWQVVYIYFFASLIGLFLCLGAFLIIVRRNHKADLFDWVGITTRAIGVICAAALMSLGIRSDYWLYRYLSTPSILPTAVFLLFFIIFCDRIAAVIANWRLSKSGKPFDDENAHGHGHSHSPSSHSRAHSRSPSGFDHGFKLGHSKAGSTATRSPESNANAFEMNTTYRPHLGHQHSSSQASLLAPTPPVEGGYIMHPQASMGGNGYVPIGDSQHRENVGA